MAMTEPKQLPAPSEEKEQKIQIIEPIDIVKATFKSLDDQVDALDKIPEHAATATQQLIDIVFNEKDFFSDSKEKGNQAAFIKAVLGTSEEVGHAMHTILEIERGNPKDTNRQTISMPQIPLPGPTQQQIEKTSPVVVTSQVKGGGWSDYFATRRWAGMFEKFLSAQKELVQSEITSSSKVVDILDYGRQLEGEWMKLMDFYDKATKWLRFYNDPNTYQNLRQEVQMHVTKMSSIIRAFARTIVEYRKERFGDRKASVAAGAMWLEGMRAGTGGQQQGVSRDGLHQLWANRDKEQPH
jgi:hypothetical protein